MFKPGDKAWHPQYGWGKVEENKPSSLSRLVFVYKPLPTQSTMTKHGIPINESGKENEFQLNPVIFKKEQKFDLSEPEPEIGTWGYFWTGTREHCLFGRLQNIRMGAFEAVDFNIEYKYFSPYPSLPQHIKDMMEGKG